MADVSASAACSCANSASTCVSSSASFSKRFSRTEDGLESSKMSLNPAMVESSRVTCSNNSVVLFCISLMRVASTLASLALSEFFNCCILSTFAKYGVNKLLPIIIPFLFCVANSLASALVILSLCKPI